MVKRKIFLFLILGLFMISFSSAFNWNDGLPTYYKLDGITGDVIDATGTNNATNNGATRGITGKINNSFSFDGISDNVTSDSNTGISGTDNRTINVWVNVTAVGDADTILSIGANGGGSFMSIVMGIGGDGNWGVRESLSGLQSSTSSSTDIGSWVMMTVTYDGSNLTLWRNGINIASALKTLTTVDGPIIIGNSPEENRDANAIIDEVGIWNRTLNQSEILELWNGGDGLPYNPIIAIPIILDSPLNDTTIADIGINFTVSGDVTEKFNTTNVTYYIWNAIGTLHNKTTVILNPNQLFNETLFIDNFTIGEYIWNAQICYENSTFSNCTFAENNFTFSVNIFEQISFSYDLEITEGASNSVNSSIIIFPGDVLTGALLEYNGTNYTTSLIFSGGVYTILSSTVAPTVNLDTNFTFKFYYLINGVYHQSEEQNQTVLNTLFGICGGVSNDTLLNLFLLDEKARTSLVGEIEVNAEVVSMTSDEVVGVLNGSFSGVDNVSICFTPPSVYASYYLNAEIKYTATDYVSELYYIQRSDLENYPANLSLLTLSQNDSTEFSITYKNNAFIFVEDAIIQLQRKYVGQNIYETVEAPITGNGGETVLHIDLNSNIYRASVVKDGVLLDFFDNIVFSCDNELSGDCTHSLDGTVDPNNDIPIEELTDFTYSVSIDEENQTVTVLFAVPSGAPSTINVLLKQIDMFGNLTSCNTTIVTSAGSITCDYADTIEKSILELSISKNGVQLVVKSYVNDPDLDMDGMNFFIVFLFMISLVGMAIASPEWMIIISVMILIISGTMLLLNGMSLVMGLGAIAWVVVAAAIIIFKMAKQEDR